MLKTRKIIIWIIIILLIAGVAIFYLMNFREKTDVYTTENVRRGNLIQTISAMGKINPKKEYNLSFGTSGKILSLNFKEGDYVKKGEKIGIVDAGELYSKLIGAQAEVEAQRKTLDSMKSKKNIYDKNQRQAQKEIIKKAEASVRLIYNQLRDTIIYSPVDGIVIRKNYNIGEMVPVNAIVITVAEKSDLICEVNVSESDIVKIKLNQQATLSIDAFSSDEKLNAEVVEIEPAATVIQDVVYYKVRLKIRESDKRLKIGMSVDVDIKTAEVENALIIPLRAVKKEDEKEYVEILKIQNKKKFTEKIYIKTGLRGNEGMVEVVSGLFGEEKIITFVKTK